MESFEADEDYSRVNTRSKGATANRPNVKGRKSADSEDIEDEEEEEVDDDIQESEPIVSTEVIRRSTRKKL